jgi:hypothetical protein
MTTNNSVNSPLSGTTGTGNFVGATSPTLVTPTLGAATATSIAFSPTTGGIIGTTAADNANAGDVGEMISSVIASASGVTFSNGVNHDLTSISLTAGDWDVWGNITYTGTTITSGYSWINTSSATQPDNSVNNYISPVATSVQLGVSAPTIRTNISSTTTVYISGNVTGTGTLKACGGIYARRRR